MATWESDVVCIVANFGLLNKTLIGQQVYTQVDIVVYL